MDRDLIKQQLEYALEGTNFDDQGELYKGKVRDNYINEDTKIYADKAELNLLNNELKISMINAEDKVQINGKY